MQKQKANKNEFFFVYKTKLKECNQERKIYLLLLNFY